MAEHLKTLHQTPPRSEKFSWLWDHPTSLWFIIVIAAALRFYGLGAAPLDLDESIFANLLKDIRGSGDFTTHFSLISEAPFFLILLTCLTSAFGDSNFVLRFIPALSGVLVIPIIDHVLRQLTNSKVARITTFLCALSPFLIYYSQNARPYSLLLLILFLFYDSYLKLHSVSLSFQGDLTYRQKGRLVAQKLGSVFYLVVITQLMISSVYFSGLLLACFYVWNGLIYIYQRNKKALAVDCLVSSFSLLAMSHWFLEAYSLQARTMIELEGYLGMLSINVFEVFMNQLFFIGFDGEEFIRAHFFGLLPLFAVLVLIKALYFRWNPHPWIWGLSILPVVISYALGMLYFSRVYIGLTPFLIALFVHGVCFCFEQTAASVARLGVRSVMLVVVIIALGVFSLSSGLVVGKSLMHPQFFLKQSLAEFSESLEKMTQEGDIILMDHPIVIEAMQHHYQGKGYLMKYGFFKRPDQPSYEEVLPEVFSGNRVLFIQNGFASELGKASILWQSLQQRYPHTQTFPCPIQVPIFCYKMFIFQK